MTIQSQLDDPIRFGYLDKCVNFGDHIFPKHSQMQ